MTYPQWLAEELGFTSEEIKEIMTDTFEQTFITRDIDTTFNMIEDESGDVFWGYGHREGPEFIEEVNRWLIHACGVIDPDDLFALSQPVEHFWAAMEEPDGERFKLVPADSDPNVFPVTRLMI